MSTRPLLLSHLVATLACSAAAIGCAVAPEHEPEPGELGAAGEPACSVPAIDPGRSLVVTEAHALARFPFEAVMDRIVQSAGQSSATALALYLQWWDLNNDAAHARTAGPHCDGQRDRLGRPAVNGRAIDCPRQEGVLAATNPFDGGDDAYVPVALVNRFDLAPTDGATCGEYRVVYGKKSGASGSATDRNLIIFEAALPNPDPAHGIAGCRPVAKFWADLSANSDPVARADQLQSFYFTGLTGFAPVIDWCHYAGHDRGQIRANQFMTGRPYLDGRPLLQPWTLREYILTRSCGGAGCALVMQADSVKNNPFGQLFSPPGALSDPTFQSDFVNNQVSRLVGSDLSGLSLSTPDPFNGGESVEQGNSNHYASQMLANPPFKTAIQTKLTQLGSRLTPDDIAARATTQSCAGCHQLSSRAPLGGGLVWPGSNAFTHISETGTLSPALTGTFLPHRAEVLTDYLRSSCMDKLAPAGTAGTLGGSITD